MVEPRAADLAVNARLRAALLAMDDRLQGIVAVKVPVFTSDPNVVNGEGVYASGDWSRTRQLTAAYATEADYLRYIRTQEPAKIEAVTSLMEAFDFGSYGRIFELGCGDMIQAFHITRTFPDVEYVATDFDPFVIERCESLPLLGRIRKQVFDVLRDPHEAFADAGLLVSWGLDAALDDTQLSGLLASAARQRVPYLMCSPTTIGPLVFLRQLAGASARARLLADRRIRMHGWARSLRYFGRMARAAGIRMRPLGRHSIYQCVLFTA